MSKRKLQESEPLFWAYGHAVYAAQILEHGIQLLLFVVDNERKQFGLSQLNVGLDDQKSKKTLGALFNKALMVEYITEPEKKMIRSAIRDRNIFVRSYWDEKHILASLKPNGREWLINDLLQRKKRCRKADSIIPSLIDQYLTKYGTSIDALSIPVFVQWENNVEPPDDVMHYL